MELSFCDLRTKDVINICDGKNLGNINDIIIDSTCGKVCGITVPYSKNFFNIFKSNNNLFIPYNRICKIGKDIILVDIIMQDNCCNNQYTYNQNNFTNNQNITCLSINDILNKTQSNKKDF